MCMNVCACMCRSACVVLLLALVAAEHDKRAEMSPMPFLMVTRYGRSSSGPQRHLSPRADRFFVGSRYGKRSDVTLAGAAGGAGGAGGTVGAEGGAARALLCEFTGVFPLYRCRHKLATYDKRRAEDTGEREEE